MSVTVYTKPSCPQCNATKRQLDKQGIAYDVIDIATTEGALEKLQAAGFRQAPVVITDNDSWSGYRPDKIKELAMAMSAADAPVAA